jgi:hypothetical protein
MSHTIESLAAIPGVQLVAGAFIARVNHANTEIATVGKHDGILSLTEAGIEFLKTLEAPAEKEALKPAKPAKGSKTDAAPASDAEKLLDLE